MGSNHLVIDFATGPHLGLVRQTGLINAMGTGCEEAGPRLSAEVVSLGLKARKKEADKHCSWYDRVHGGHRIVLSTSLHCTQLSH